MTAYFKKIFGYDAWANLKILNLIIASGATGKPVEMMAHMMAAQQIWLKRCKHLPAPGGPLWPEYSVAEISELIDQNHVEWVNYLDTVNQFDQIITYKNTQGIEFKTVLSDIITQVTNHGTHHRGQIGARLKAEGLELPGLDYILYSRTIDHQL